MKQLVVALAVLLAAFCAATPAVWTHPFPSPQSATNPTIFDGLIYVPTNTTLHCLNLTTGSSVWTFDYSFGDKGGYAAVDSKYVYVGTMNSIYALNHSGHVRWVFPNPYSATVHFMRPSIGQDGVYVTSGYAPLIKLSHHYGVIQWIASTTLGFAQLHATEEQTGQTVYVVSVINNTQSFAVALDTATGAYRWQVNGVVTIIVSDSTGYLFCQGGTSLQSTLTAVRLTDGSMAYTYVYEGIGAVDYYLYDSTLYVNIGVTAAAYPTSLIQYNAATGQANWQINNVPFLFFIPSAAGVVVFGTSTAVAYGAETGAIKWTYEGVAVNDGATTSANETVMITSTSVVLLPAF